MKAKLDGVQIPRTLGINTHAKEFGNVAAPSSRSEVAARVLATYLIPGCVGRGVRLGSENSSGAGAGGAAAGGGVWKSGGHFSGKKKAPAATYPQVQGFQKSRGHFSEKKRRLRQRSQPLRASKKSKK